MKLSEVSNIDAVQPTSLKLSDVIGGQEPQITQPKNNLVAIAGDAIKNYFTNAQPAFKLAVTHPETFMGKPATNYKTGKPLTPDQLNEATNKDWADIYRGANLPFSKSQSAIAQTIPQAAGMLLDIGTRPSSAIVPKVAENGIVALTQSPATRGLLEKYTPTLAGDVLRKFPLNSQTNKAIGVTTKLIDNTAKTLSSERGGVIPSTITPEQALSNINDKIDKTIEYGIIKGIRPTVAGRKTINRQDKFFTDAKNAVRMIVDNKDNLNLVDSRGNIVNRTPQTVSEMAQAIENTKNQIYSEYTNMAKQSGNVGAMFNTSNIENKLDSISNDIKYNPQIRNYAKGLKANISELNGADPLTVQARIKDLNASLEGYYRGMVSKAQAQVDASVANLMRGEIDGLIEKSQGMGYGNLKKAYGALKSLEADVNHGAIVYGRQSPRTVFDLTDIFTGGDILHGALTLNPAQMTRGAVMMGVKNFYKKLNSPDYIISNMFSKTERLMNQAERLSSRTPKAVESEVVDNIPTFNGKALSYTGRKALPDMTAGGITDKTGNVYGEGFTSTSKRTIPRYGKPYVDVNANIGGYTAKKPLTIGYRPKTENLGVMVNPEPNMELSRVNSQIENSLKMIPSLQRRGMVNQVAEVKRNISSLLEKQKELYLNIEQSKKLKSALDIALGK